MNLFARIQKRRAIKSYINNLGRDLAKRYGKSKTYTPSQVVTTVHDRGYNWQHICYAHALYVTPKQFDRWHEEQGESCDYASMREEIAQSHFGGSVEALSSSSFGSAADSAADIGDFGGGFGSD